MRISDWSSDVCSSDLFVATVADQRDDTLRCRLSAAVAQRRRQQRAGAGAAEDALAAQQQPCGVETFAVRNLEILAHAVEFAVRRHEVLADTLHPPTPGRLLTAAAAQNVGRHQAQGNGR